jgi:cell fate regulator YaaT (PSP1 superfamily)
MNEASITKEIGESEPKFDAVLSPACFCRIGRHGEIGCFIDRDRAQPSRGRSVVLRTRRGLEVGTVLRTVEIASQSYGKLGESTSVEFDGTLLRICTPEDQILREKLEQAAMAAFNSCQDYLALHQLGDTLLDVEALLDAKTLYFYFLGEPSEVIAQQLDRLVEIFQTTVRESQFAKLLEEGCGPGCGSEEKGSCGTSGSCAVCVIAKSCKK